MDFASDNWAGASAPVAAALAEEALAGPAPAYGNDEATRRVEAEFGRIFERDVRVFFVATGTAANILSLEAMMRPGGIVLCHPEAHVRVDEGGAAQHHAGIRLHPVPGRDGKIDAAGVEAAIAGFTPFNVHHGRPVAVTITQASELGTVYAPDEVAAISTVARRHGLGVHMDGARFANALVATGAEPADLTWRAGVDILSFGGTKNGCWCAEAVVLFDPARADEFAYAHKRGAQLFSKSRFVAVQFLAQFAGGHWLDNARHANAMARRLADGIRARGAGALLVDPQANEIFVRLDEAVVRRLQEAGARFARWPDAAPREGRVLVRLVASFATSPADVDRFLDALGAG